MKFRIQLDINDTIKRLLLSECGQVGDDEVVDETAPVQDDNQGTGNVDEGLDSDVDGNVAVDPNTPSPAATDATQGEDTFLQGSDLDPRKLPPELQPIFKRMQGVYTKKFQDIASLREKASTVDRFYSDPGFAQQTLVGWAAQNGYQLTPIGGGPQAGQQQQQRGPQGAPSAEVVEAFKSNLAPELQWMAEPMAAAMGQSLQSMLDPVLKQQQGREATQQKEQATAEFNKYADNLRSTAPGWEEHEDVMTELHDFLRSPAFNHPKYGSKIEMLYNLATGKASAIKQATSRVNAAAKNRVSSGRSGQSRVPAIGDRVATSKTSDDAWALAKQHALSTVGKR